MDLSTHSISSQSYQSILYDRALHPELFDLRSRRVFESDTAELELWLIPGCHLLRFGRGRACATELIIDRERGLPEVGVVSASPCSGEHEFEHKFAETGVSYMTSVQTESLSENLFASTMREMRVHANENESVAFEWETRDGANLSLVDVQQYRGEMHAQAYHLVARDGFVLRSQTLFEYK